MNTEERRLSDWLHAQTPQPPRNVSADDIAARVIRPPARRSWAPVLAAACVVLVAVASVLAGSAEWSKRSHPAGPVTSRAARPPKSSPAAGGVKVGPWDATTVGGAAAGDVPLAGDSASLYVTDPNDVRGTRTILRLDPESGAVLARGSYPYPAGEPLRVVIMAGALWAAGTGSGGSVSVRGLDLTTLAPVASVTVRVPGGTGPGGLAALAANAGDSRLYVGAGHTIAVIDATTRRIIRQYQVTGAPITDLAVNPDDTRLYITRNPQGGAASSLTVTNPDTGSTLARPVQIPGGGGVIAASAGGVWLEYGSGHEAWIYFFPASDLARPRGPLATGGGGFAVTSTVTAGVVWLGGTDRMVCADPQTGEVRASARTPTPTGVTSSGRKGAEAADISDLIPAGGHLFAYYLAGTGPSGLLTRLSPPAPCTR